MIQGDLSVHILYFLIVHTCKVPVCVCLPGSVFASIFRCVSTYF